MMSSAFLKKIVTTSIALGLLGASPLVLADSPGQASAEATQEPDRYKSDANGDKQQSGAAMGAGRTGADADIRTGTEASVEIESDAEGDADTEADFDTGSEEDWPEASKQQAGSDEDDEQND